MKKLRHTITYNNDDGEQVQKHFYSTKDVYAFLNDLPNGRDDVWTKYQPE